MKRKGGPWGGVGRFVMDSVDGSKQPRVVNPPVSPIEIGFVKQHQKNEAYEKIKPTIGFNPVVKQAVFFEPEINDKRTGDRKDARGPQRPKKLPFYDLGVGGLWVNFSVEERLAFPSVEDPISSPGDEEIAQENDQKQRNGSQSPPLEL